MDYVNLWYNNLVLGRGVPKKQPKGTNQLISVREKGEGVN